MILSTIYILISSVLGYRLQRVCLQITPVLNLESCIWSSIKVLVCVQPYSKVNPPREAITYMLRVYFHMSW
ncbi:hypothetical protein QL093DRAFT_1502496 [Fusarium oxysporum]|nr:hypothetical protein QL093DRAFT_1502496 [Fusarium oxysporum]